MAAGRRIVLEGFDSVVYRIPTIATFRPAVASSGGVSEHFCIAETILISSVIERVGENSMSVLSD